MKMGPFCLMGDEKSYSKVKRLLEHIGSIFLIILIPERISSLEQILPVWNTSVPDYEIAVFKTHQFRV